VTQAVQFPTPATALEAAIRGSDGLLGLVARAGARDAVLVEQLYQRREWGVDPAEDPNLRYAL
jgi:hypothetical protein